MHVPSVETTATEFVVSGLANGTSYTFAVVAENSAGRGPAALSNVVTTPDVPAAPTAVIANPVGSLGARVAWNRPASNGGRPISSYIVSSSTGSTTVVLPTESTAVLSNLSRAAVSFTVRAVNAVGEGPDSAPSNEITPLIPPQPPTGVNAVPGNGQVLLSWSGPADNGGAPISEYVVAETAGAVAPVSVAGRTDATVTGLRNGQAYVFSVAAVTPAGMGAAALSNTVVPYTVPAPPAQVTAVAGNSQATVSWTPSSDNGRPITAFHVRASNDGGFLTVSDGGTTVDVSGLRNGTPYTFTVAAENLAGEGPASLPSNLVIPVGPPTAPVGVTARALNQSATIRWSPPLNSGGSAVLDYLVTSSPAGFSTTTTGPATQATVAGLQYGTIYSFTVRARTALGLSPASLPSNPVAPAAPCATRIICGELSTLDGYGSGIASGDFNADGRLDVAMSGGPTRVFIGTGDGTFSQGGTYASSDSDIVAADFNGDGRQDLTVGEATGTRVLWGRGDGSFDAGSVQPLPGFPAKLASGDFNSDGRLDLAAACSSAGACVLLNAPGGFGAATAYDVGTDADYVATGDFNADGRLDLAVSPVIGAQVSVLAGNANGTFGSPVSFAVAQEPLPLTTGDFNSDGRTDLVTGVSLLISSPMGMFLPAVQLAVPTSFEYQRVMSLDINADGNLDVVLQEANSPQHVGVLLGNGNGTFRPFVMYLTRDGAQVLVSGDFNGDTRMDLAVGGSTQGRLDVLLGRGDGTLVAPAVTGPRVGLHDYVATSDLDADGRLDVVVCSSVRLGVLMNTANGVLPFSSATSYGSSSFPLPVSAPAAADLDGDGYPDVVVGSNRKLSVLTSRGDGGLSPPMFFDGGTADTPGSPVVGDFNLDGRLDVAVALRSEVAVMLRDSSGAYGSGLFQPVGGLPSDLVAADLNADGWLDLAVSVMQPLEGVAVLLGRGDGTFSHAASIPTAGGPLAIASGDFNADGRLDLAVLNNTAESVSVLLAGSAGAFAAPLHYPVGVRPRDLFVVDANGDGFLDLAIAEVQDGQWHYRLLRGNGSGAFAPWHTFLAGHTRAQVIDGLGRQPFTSGDFNADGRADFAMVGTDSDIAFLIGASCACLP